MRQLNEMELSTVSGGLDAGKPVLQANLSDVVEGFCIWTGMSQGFEMGSKSSYFGQDSLGGYGSQVGGLVGGFAGAVAGGVVSHVALRTVPAVTGMINGFLPV